MPGLKRLDLRSMPLESQHLPILLGMAAKYSLQVEMLVLPRKQEMGTMVNCAAIRRVMKVLRGAMERWHLNGKCGGLKQLTVPTREEEDRAQTSTRFIEDVIEFCPNVEYIDGYSHAIDEMNDVTCEEKWMISLETWEQFNKTCTKLREFHWVVVLFADPFFRMFGEHVKPNLKKLTLTSNLSWEWGDYFNRDGSTGSPTEKPGYGLLANDVIALFKGCPALTELDISIDQEKNQDELATLLDADVFGDKFWEAVAHLCPLLQSVYLHDSSGYGGSRTVRPIQTFTDRGLLALAEHTRLNSIELSTVCCSGGGVFEYLQYSFTTKQFAGENRTLDLSLAGQCDHDTALPHPFYFELLALLLRLAETSEKALGVTSCSYKASLNIFNPHSGSVDKKWSIPYVRDELKPILEKVASAHPSLDIHLVLCRDNEDSFRRIDNLELDWCLGSQQGEMFIEDEYVGDTDSNDGGSDEEGEFFDDEDGGGPLDPHDIFLRRHAMFMDDDYEIVPAGDVDGV
ncbi:Internal alternative NAD(P)H-ubiquinone oxidoreductase A1, mitochondrial [Phytophthora pseudosyringae]|uniref:Internal alternative NAD(P)H-ubiquinone oxidoreductase A1, mitochondrial n=1 Tax=Phytophthora pseudosyringae TaxID=221518 RepID=A0A8T1WGF4_9STRA|nr:Internal alternative NAD(P)H-ubiquinone oxidoreductase A1, mitochondrial [Phytophthora pseudosyringae]